MIVNTSSTGIKNGKSVGLSGVASDKNGIMQSKRASSRMEAGTSGVLSISDSGRRYLPSMDKRVTPRLLWRNGSPLAF